MIIEIRRAGFNNKGAELMLRAVAKEISERIPDAKLVMVPDYPDTFCERGKLCLHQKPWFYRGGIRWGNLALLVPKWIRRQFGIYVDKEIDVVLDAAGFVYTSEVPRSRLKEIAASAKLWKKRGTRLVLLPQAFGPFPDVRRQRYVSRFVRNAELVYARDKESYEHIVHATGDRPNIKIAPDFTSLIDGVFPESFNQAECRFCLIPNSKMLNKTTPEDANRYLGLMADLVRRLVSVGAMPYVLLHEMEKDSNLAKEILARAKTQIPVIRESNALAIKGIIGQSDGVISSRFHGLVSALSQGVPAFGTSWSHKYRMLFEDYDFPAGLLTVTDDYDSVWRVIEYHISEPKNSELRRKLLTRARTQREASRTMWDEIIPLITSKVTAP